MDNKNAVQSVPDQIREIKQSFRQMMDGAVAQSMRQKGVDYHLNWGITLPRLRQLADDIIRDNTPQTSNLKPQTSNLQPPTSNLYALAIALWKENVRECKILATMLMPPEQMLPEVTDIWMEQTDTIEIAEQAAMNLYQHLPFAAEKAYQWIASPQEIYQLCGFHVLSRLFMQGREPNERGINEFIDQALVAIQGPTLSVRKAANNSLLHFASLGLVYERLANSALRTATIQRLAI